ncbi:glutamyl-tRNA reductase [Magnetospira sp. QH-2]|uniref:glutamyl-tRNA reductase n=1 Tax=Magnetospira sp. (strain QH-2) TaxID=1288970 RepID=UPI0005F9D9DC|nr:glutamyl-tRNA reductase [Magnetospira sp. QH-2]
MTSDGLNLRPIVVGANHKSSSLGLRDKLFVEDEQVSEVLDSVRALGFEQAMVFSTCDRVDLLVMTEDPEAAIDPLRALLANRAEQPVGELIPALYAHRDEQAVRHLFAVAASLDSQVVGEPQVLGQLKACHRLAKDSGHTAGELESLVQAAYAAAKRVRTETPIGKRPVSIASAAVELARDLHGDLGRCTALMIGVGDMGELVGRALSQGGLSHLTLSHPKPARAEHLAQTLNCHLLPFEELADKLPEADILITALSARVPTIDPDKLRAALKLRRHKPIFLIDTGIPGDVDPAVNRVEEAFLYDLGDLERVAMDGMNEREADAVTAWRIIDEEVTKFMRDRDEREAVPVLTLLHDLVEAERVRALGDSPNDAAKATHLVTARLLHGPTEALRDMAAAGEDLEPVERLLRRLFEPREEDPS